MAVVITPPGKRGGGKTPGPLVRLFSAMNVGVYRIFARRRFMGMRLLLLKTIGAKSGKPRSATLGYFADGPSAWLVVGSAGGSAHHPDWLYNLARHPEGVEIELEGRSIRVKPETLSGVNREAAWQRIVAECPMYNRYIQQTDREIPIIRLTAV